MKKKIFCLSLVFVLSLFITSIASKAEAQLSLDAEVTKDFLDITYQDHPLSIPQNIKLTEGETGNINISLPILPPIFYFPLGALSLTNNGMLDDGINLLDTSIGGSFFFGLIPIPPVDFPVPFGRYAIDVTPLGQQKTPISEEDKLLGGIIASILLTSTKAEYDIYIDLSGIIIEEKGTATPENPIIVIPLEIPVEIPEGIEAEVSEIEPVILTIEFEFGEIITTVEINIQGPEEISLPPIPVPNGSFYLKLQPEDLDGFFLPPVEFF